MNEDQLQSLLKQADERFGRAAAQTSGHDNAAFVVAVCSRRARQLRHRKSIGVVAVLMLVGGISAWSLSTGHWSDSNLAPEMIASIAESQRNSDTRSTNTDEPPQNLRGVDQEIAAIRDQIAALDAEAEQAHRLVELYRAAESRRERLAAAEQAAMVEPLLPPQALAELQIDRAAAITVISADTQAKVFNRLEEAAEAYRSVLTYFPGSQWASVARERLAQARHMN